MCRDAIYRGRCLPGREGGKGEGVAVRHLGRVLGVGVRSIDVRGDFALMDGLMGDALEEGDVWGLMCDCLIRGCLLYVLELDSGEREDAEARP